MRATALSLSVLFHPLLMATYGCALLLFGIRDSVYYFLTPDEIKWRILLLVFSMTFLLPVLSIWLLFRLKIVPSFLLSDRGDRTFPYFVTALFYLGLFYWTIDLDIWNTLKLFFFGAGLTILLTALINYRYKISAHMVGLGGLLGVLIAVSSLLQLNLTPLYVSVVLVSGTVASSRVYLNEHRNGELLAGFLLGLFVQSALFFTLRQLSLNYLL